MYYNARMTETGWTWLQLMCCAFTLQNWVSINFRGVELLEWGNWAESRIRGWHCIDLIKQWQPRGMEQQFPRHSLGEGAWDATVNWFFSYSIFMGKLRPCSLAWKLHRSPSCHAMCCVEFEFKPFWAVTLCDIVWHLESCVDLWFKVSLFFYSIEILMARRWLGVGR